MAAKGALGTDPKFITANSTAGLQQQQANLQKEIQRRGGAGKAPQFAQRLQQVNQAMTTMQAPTTQAPPVDPGFTAATGAANNGLMSAFGQMSAQGAFNPGSFEDLQKQGYNSAMNSFDTSMNPQFQQQKSEFDQRMAEMGVAPGTESYDAQYKNMMGSQNTARQQAMDSAFGQGLNAEGQAFNQAATQYQMPAQNVAALSPFYQAQNQGAMQGQAQNFQAGQSGLDRSFQQQMAAIQQKYNMQQLNFQASHRAGGGGGGGGGGLTLQDQMALQNNAFYNNLALTAAANGQGPPLPSAGNGFATGVAQGVTQGALGAALK